jgi:hypothetical protein
MQGITGRMVTSLAIMAGVAGDVMGHKNPVADFIG